LEDKDMPRLSDLNDVLFPVEEHPVFVSIPGPAGERRIEVPYKKAIVHGKVHRVLGIVSRGYRLVTNREALDWAHRCCRTVFPETKPGEWEVTVADAPGTGSHCFIDLTHNSTALDFQCVPAQNRPEVYGPFIRVTNSYNGARALGFDVGFYRKVCSNGLILPESIIRFKFTHLPRDIGETIQFDIAQDLLAGFRTKFNGLLGHLHACAVPRAWFESFLFAILSPSVHDEPAPGSRKSEDLDKLLAHLGKLSDRYVEELGENAYAVFNAVTDFASRPPANRFVGRERHSLQRLAGSWLSEFSQECQKPGFDLGVYLDEQEARVQDRTPQAGSAAKPSRNSSETN
jgi:hypothetical protein